jgi:hypothetical protein
MPRRSFLLKSSLSNQLFDHFTASYQSLPDSVSDYENDVLATPYVYVDHDGVVKLLTNIVDDNSNADGIFAVSVAGDGLMEFLAVQSA